jgi:hypothetical protein
MVTVKAMTLKPSNLYPAAANSNIVRAFPQAAMAIGIAPPPVAPKPATATSTMSTGEKVGIGAAILGGAWAAYHFLIK